MQRVQALLGLAILVAGTATAAEPPPVEWFTNPAKLDSLAISPSGNYIATTHRQDDRHVLTISEFPSTRVKKVLNYRGQLDVADLKWIDDHDLVIQPARVIAEEGDGKYLTGEIFRVDVDAGRSTALYSPYTGSETSYKAAKRDSSLRPVEILSTNSGKPGEILIQTLPYIIPRLPSVVFRLDVKTGRSVGVASAPVLDVRFVAGAARRVAVAYGTDEKYRSVLYYLPESRGTEPADWELKLNTRREEGALLPIGWTGKGEEFYALDSRDAPTLGVVVWNAVSNTTRLLHRNAAGDMISYATDPQGIPWMFAGYDHYPVYWYPDPQHPLAAMHQKLVQALPRHSVEVTSQTDDLSRAVVRISAGDRPPVFLVVEVATAKLLLRMDTFPDLKPTALADVEPFEFKARDGLAIRGYLTRPRDASGQPRRNLPTIVMIHGGPHGPFDRYAYEYSRQLFASRGYAVLQVNFRGSGGRGRDFESAGYGEWGRKMQDDVTDGVRWAIQTGAADADRICIYGASYGAYSALVGVGREPDMFKCAAGYAGVYDLPLMFSRGDIRMQSRGISYLRDALGDDERELARRSPVNMAAAIKAKVLLIHGSDDVRAPLAHATRMRAALTDAGNPPQWLVEGGERHGFNNPENRAGAYRTLLEFFARNIGN